MATSHNTCNTFVDLNGIPYLNAEYLDNTKIQQIDRSAIFSQINIDNSEPMRTVIAINVDDIGTTASGALAAQGNNTKQKALLKMVSQYAERAYHKLPTLRKGMVVRVNYQLENAKTGRIIRSAIDDFRIENREYYLDINSSNLNDNSVITCFADTEVSTLSEFTHGFEPMNLRITHVNLFYETVQDDFPSHCHPPRYRHHHCDCDHGYDRPYPEMDNYYIHKNCQNQHFMDAPDPCNYYGAKDVPMIANPSWNLINRFYHFENKGKDIIIHGQEVYNNRTHVNLIPCGTVSVNRLFMINPAQRLIFKFCVWKNDITVVDDTTMIGQALGAPYQDINIDMTDTDTCLCRPLPHFIHPDDETFRRLFASLQQTDIDQNHNINQLINVTNTLSESLTALQDTISTMQKSITDISKKLNIDTSDGDKDPAIDDKDPLNPDQTDGSSSTEDGPKDNTVDGSETETPDGNSESSDDQAGE